MVSFRPSQKVFKGTFDQIRIILTSVHHCPIAYIRTVFRIRIRIHRIHMFLDLPDPDPDLLVRCMDPDPDPYIGKQK
jgi:hypothetical protein